MDCINQNQDSYRATTWDSAMSQRSAPLMVVGVWWSAKQASVPLTVTTQMSAARLWQLKALCMQYPGPVSAVLYVGSSKGRVLHENGLLSIMVRQAESLFNAMEIAGRCKLDLMLVREVFEHKEAKIWYPVNQLRNYARLQARTPLIGIIDADLLVSPTLVKQLIKRDVQKQYLRQLSQLSEKVVYVLPAFQTPAHQHREEATLVADRAVSLQKDQLKSWWFKTASSYEVGYESRYEPWVMCDRRSVPWHDHIFKGYGLNKIMHLEHMNSTGYKFMVEPTTFLIHRAHRSTHAKNLVISAKKRQKIAYLPAQPAVPTDASVLPSLGKVREIHQSFTVLQTQRDVDDRKELSLVNQAQGEEEGSFGGEEEDEVGPEEVEEHSVAAAAVDESKGRSLLNDEDGKEESTYAYTQRLGAMARRRMAAGTYEPHVDAAVRACLERLPWWRISAV
ncbi:hypothetical protein CEUSTIGMA_g10823.t1 [Chlamydomonas eustigma]|uniref:Glycosyltransferase-like protein LARGE2 n=1 Tax=Chlamydomonas eustigma TaxID=1157962 RepID=A0A250XK03_9CHLO|nr:hypothetical protein CEUSTIGMA_g10823.t1 [Chlamydomonas eustigma]|eukprot:GAX83398.1 hypothetical protein CEUSTIGMA_g10823.t1 [Chlamydomonas eustigma]